MLICAWHLKHGCVWANQSTLLRFGKDCVLEYILEKVYFSSMRWDIMTISISLNKCFSSLNAAPSKMLVPGLCCLLFVCQTIPLTFSLWLLCSTRMSQFLDCKSWGKSKEVGMHEQSLRINGIVWNCLVILHDGNWKQREEGMSWWLRNGGMRWKRGRSGEERVGGRVMDIEWWIAWLCIFWRDGVRTWGWWKDGVSLARWNRTNVC